MASRRPYGSSNGSTWLWLLILALAIAILLFYGWQRGGGSIDLPALFGGSGESAAERVRGAASGNGAAATIGSGGAAGAGVLAGGASADGTPVGERAGVDGLTTTNGALQSGGQVAADGQVAASEQVAPDGQVPATPGPDGPEEAAPSSGPKYPLPAGAAQAGDPSLPDPARSDEPILEALTGIAPRVELGRFGNIGDFTRRVVITVDNLPRERVPAQYSIVQRIPGALVIDNRDNEVIELNPENSRRYDTFVSFATSIGARHLASVYLRFYPLFQREYQLIGFPDGHFHDRVIEAIDDMLAAPSPRQPIRLRQPKVHYIYADPALERLSAGQKIMIRIGPENAARLKQLLRELRVELIGQRSE